MRWIRTRERERERNTKFFHDALPYVKTTQKHIHVNQPHAPSQRVMVDMADRGTHIYENKVWCGVVMMMFFTAMDKNKREKHQVFSSCPTLR